MCPLPQNGKFMKILCFPTFSFIFLVFPFIADNRSPSLKSATLPTQNVKCHHWDVNNIFRRFKATFRTCLRSFYTMWKKILLTLTKFSRHVLTSTKCEKSWKSSILSHFPLFPLCVPLELTTWSPFTKSAILPIQTAKCHHWDVNNIFQRFKITFRHV